ATHHWSLSAASKYQTARSTTRYSQAHQARKVRKRRSPLRADGCSEVVIVIHPMPTGRGSSAAAPAQLVGEPEQVQGEGTRAGTVRKPSRPRKKCIDAVGSGRS